MNTSAPTGTPPTRGDNRVGQVYLLFVICLLLMLTVGLAVQQLSLVYGLAVTELVLILLPAIVFVWRKRLPIAAGLGWRPVSIPVLLLSVAVGVTSWGVAAGLALLTQSVLGPMPGGDTLRIDNMSGLMAILIPGALLAGFCEESLFRGVMQGVLYRKGAIRAVIVTSFLFALFHVNPWIFLATFFLGVVFGTLAIRTGSIVPSIAAHIVNNTLAFSVRYFYGGGSDSSGYWLIGALAAACLVTYPLFWRSAGQLPPPPALSTVPAAPRRLAIWIIGIAGSLFAILLLLLVAAVFMLVHTATVADDSLLPDAGRGDQLIVLSSDIGKLDLEPGDIVEWKQKGKTKFVKVTRVEEKTVSIQVGDEEIEIARGDLAGKVVHIVKAR